MNLDEIEKRAAEVIVLANNLADGTVANESVAMMWLVKLTPQVYSDVQALLAEVRRLRANYGRAPFSNPPIDEASIAAFNALDEE